MRQFEIKNPYDGKYYKRISKSVAKKDFDAGKTIVWCPNKLHTFTEWHCGIEIKKDTDEMYNSFEAIYNRFSYYNCNSESGKYISFYEREEPC